MFFVFLFLERIKGWPAFKHKWKKICHFWKFFKCRCLICIHFQVLCRTDLCRICNKMAGALNVLNLLPIWIDLIFAPLCWPTLYVYSYESKTDIQTQRVWVNDDAIPHGCRVPQKLLLYIEIHIFTRERKWEEKRVGAHVISLYGYITQTHTRTHRQG